MVKFGLQRQSHKRKVGTGQSESFGPEWRGCEKVLDDSENGTVREKLDHLKL